MIKYNKPALEGYLRGCLDITRLAKQAIGDVEEFNVVSGHIDFRHHDKDIIILGVKCPELTKDEVYYWYRTVRRSEGPNGFSTDSVTMNIKTITAGGFTEVTGNRIRRITMGRVTDKVTNINYTVETNSEIFFDGTLRNKVHYWYSDGTKPSDTPDGVFFFHGRFDGTPRHGQFKSPQSLTGIEYAAITDRVLYDEIAAHEKKNRQ